MIKEIIVRTTEIDPLAYMIKAKIVDFLDRSNMLNIKVNIELIDDE